MGVTVNRESCGGRERHGPCRAAALAMCRHCPPPPLPSRFCRTPPQMELSGAGLYAKRVSDDMVELTWKTGNEKGNLGFIVSRRAAKTDGWEEIASFNDFPPLNSKG